MSNSETIQYSVCDDCHLFIAYGEECDDGSSEASRVGIERAVGNKRAHFVNGIEPDEVFDPNGEGHKEFSKHPCELCGSHLAGRRHGATLIIQLNPKA